MRASGLDYTIFAPSVIFGRGDAFLNKFAKMVSLLPPLAPMALPGASARFQPVWVDDVAGAFVAALHARQHWTTLRAGWPKAYRCANWCAMS